MNTSALNVHVNSRWSDLKSNASSTAKCSRTITLTISLSTYGTWNLHEICEINLKIQSSLNYRHNFCSNNPMPSTIAFSFSLTSLFFPGDHSRSARISRGLPYKNLRRLLVQNFYRPFTSPKQQCQRIQAINIKEYCFLSLRFKWPFFRWTWVSRCLLKHRTMKLVVTTGATRRAMLQSNHHHQQTTYSFLQGQMPFCRPTNSVKALKGKNITFHGLAYYPKLTWGLPTLSLTHSSSRLPG